MLKNFLADLVEAAFEPDRLKDALTDAISIDYEAVAEELVDDYADMIQELAEEYARTVL